MTRQQAIEASIGDTLHYTGRRQCERTIGSRGGVRISVVRVRVSGRCQTWVRDAARFRLPVKYGLYESSAVEAHNMADFHLASECPVSQL